MKSKTKSKTIPEDKLKLYQNLVNSVPGIEIKSNFGFPYTSLNGNMYSLLSKSGYVGIRLPKEAREKFLEEFSTEIYKPEPGPLLKEYVKVPDDLLANTDELKKYLEISFEYAKSLKPK